MIRSTAFKGGSILKTGIFGNCVFATFSKNIKHLTFAGCQSEIPFNFSQLLSILFESEDLLPICYRIFDDVLVWLSRCILQEAGILVRVSDWCDVWRVSDWWSHLRKHLGRNATNYFKYLMGRYKRVPGGLYEEPHPPSLLKFIHLLHANQASV